MRGARCGGVVSREFCGVRGSGNCENFLVTWTGCGHVLRLARHEGEISVPRGNACLARVELAFPAFGGGLRNVVR